MQTNSTPACAHCGNPCKHKGTTFCSNKCHGLAQRVPISKRFWSKVLKSDGCWEWQSGISAEGYGFIQDSVVDGKQRRFLAHRVSWELTHGPIPDGLWVLHHCDNRKCVRPDHLFLGNHVANMADARKKSRMAKGANHGLNRHPECRARGAMLPHSKLTPEKVRAIRAKRSEGATFAELAQEYGVSASSIRDIFNGRSWTHVL